MNFFSLFAAAVFAAESIISPIPDNTPVVIPAPAQPEISFGEIVSPPAVLAAETEATPSPTPTAPPVIQTKKKSYTIAFLGDSMIDTMGPDLPAVKHRLENMYRATTFTLLNYGAGGTNIDYGIERITSGYTYLGNTIPPLASTHPDIVVVESFGYNPFPVVDGVTRHWIALARAVDTLRASIPGVKIIIAATIAPNAGVFGDGALSWNAQQKQEKVTEINAYIESTIKFAQSQHIPLANAYHASGGNTRYINAGDHIHYSDAGRALFAQKVTDAIAANHLLQ